MVSVAGLLGEVLVPAGGVDILASLDAGLLRVLSEVGHIVRGVASLKDCIGR